MSKDYQYTKINIDEIKPYERNARIHSSKQIKQIMEAIKAFGFTNPQTKEIKEVEINQKYELLIKCKDESELEQAYNENIEKGYECKVLTF